MLFLCGVGAGSALMAAVVAHRVGVDDIALLNVGVFALGVIFGWLQARNLRRRLRHNPYKH